MKSVISNIKPWQKKSLIVVFSVLILLSTLWAFVPTFSAWLLNRYLAPYDAHFSVSEINPDLFPIGLTIKNASIEQNQQNTLELDELSVGLDFIPLFAGVLQVNHITVKNLVLSVQEKQDATYNVAGIPIVASTDENSEDTELTLSQHLASLPSFILRNANIDNINVNFANTLGTDLLSIKTLSVNEIFHDYHDWRGQFELEAGLNNAIAELSGNLDANASQVMADMDVSSLKISSKDLQNLLPSLADQIRVENLNFSGAAKATYQFDQSYLNFSSPSLSLSTEDTTVRNSPRTEWKSASARLDNLTIETTEPDDIRVFATSNVELEGLKLTYGKQSLNAKSLALSNTLQLEKQAEALVIQQGDTVITAKDINAKQDQTNLALKALGLTLSQLTSKLDLTTNQGEILGELNLESSTLEIQQTADADVKETVTVKTLTGNTPVNVQLKEKSQEIITPNLALKASNLGFNAYDNNGKLESAELALKDNTITINQNGSVSVLTNINASLAQFASEQPSQNGLASFARLAFNAPAKLAVQGQNLDITSKTVKAILDNSVIKSPEVNGSLEQVTVQLDQFTVKQDPKKLLVSSQAQLTTKALAASMLNIADQPPMNLSLASFKLKTQLNLEQETQQTNIISTENEVSFDTLHLEQEKVLSSSLKSFDFQNNKVTLSLHDSLLAHIEARGNTLTMSDLASTLDDSSTLLSWDQFQVDSSLIEHKDSGLIANIEHTNLSDFISSQPNATSKMPALIRFDNLAIDGVKLRSKGVEVNQIAFDKLNSGVVLSQSRELANMTLPSTLLETDSSTSNTLAAGSINSTNTSLVDNKSFYTIIHNLSVSEGSKFEFNDQGVSPALSRVLDIQQLSIENFNTRDQKETSQVLLKAKNGNYATINAEVSIQPFAKQLTMEAKAEVREVELPPISPYVSNSLGYNIQSGQLNMDLKLSSKSGELDGNTHIVLRQLDLGGQKDGNAILQAGVLPLNLAVDALKDKNNNIVLDLPMKGNIDNPSFRWQNFFLLPIKQGLYKASSMYLMQTFIPYANVISLVQMAGEQVLKIRVQPLKFEAEETDIDDPQEEFLDQLAALMKERKDAQLKACGVAVIQDLYESAPEKLSDTDKQDLIEMANDRAENLKEYLVDQDVPSGRIFICSPTIDQAKNASPRVELNF